MADSVTIRNHLFTLVNTGRIDKTQKTAVLKFLDYIDNEVLNSCMQIMPDEVQPVKPALNNDFVQAREKQQSERADMAKNANEAADAEKRSKGAFSRVQ